jgi:hypothetical protein
MGVEQAAHRRGGPEIRSASGVAQNADAQFRQARCGIGRRGD